MPDLTAGSKVNALDFPPAVYAADGTTQSNLSNTAYAVGSPEVGVTFIAPTSGRVKITVGGGLRNNAANTDRVAIAPQVFVTNSAGVEVLAPTVTRGVSSEGIASAGDFAYRSRTTLLTGLTPGQQYYARTMQVIFGSNATADLSQRDILVDPAP
jgi:hypothetical protein